MKSFGLVGRRMIVASLLLIAVASPVGAGSPAPATGPAAGSDQPARLLGRVVDPAGEPIAGAEVFAAVEAPGAVGSPAAGVLGRATTDPAGRFGVDWLDRGGDRAEMALWIHRPGYRLGCVAVADVADPAAIPVVLRPVAAPVGASVEVLGPGGEPVDGASIVPIRWYEGDLPAASTRLRAIPRPVGEALAAVTGADGRAGLDGIAALRLSAVVVESRFGSQVVGWGESLVARHRTVRLRPTGRVVGQVVATDPATAGGLVVRIESESPAGVVGWATATTDPAGRFEAPRVAAGRVAIRVEPRPGGIEVAEGIVREPLEPGGTATATVALRRGVRLAGRVAERAGGAAVAGAWVALSAPDDEATIRVRTDVAGRFAAVVPAGRLAARVESAPAPILVASPLDKPAWVDVPAAAAGFEWPTIELERGVMVAGRVVEADGRPAAPGAVVEARWTTRDGRAHAEVAAAATTGDDGRFRVGPVRPAVEVALSAHRLGARTGHATTVRTDQAEQAVALTLDQAVATFVPAGRVVDSTGRPVVGALVQFRVADPNLFARAPRLGRRLAVDGLDAVITDDLGRYVATGRVDARHRYVAAAEAAGCEAGRTRPIPAHGAAGGSLRFPDLTVDRHASPAVVVGRVVGADGRPIEGVLVRDEARHEATTGPSGWFRLEGGGDGGPAFLFAGRAGYRFAGRSMIVRDGDADRPIVLTLRRLDEPGDAGSLPDRTRDELGGQVARRLRHLLVVEPYIARTLARPDPVQAAILLERLAECDPDQVIARLRAGAIADRRVGDGLRRLAIGRLAARDFPRADREAGAIEDPAVRVGARIDALEAARGLDPAEQRERLRTLERDARSVEDLGSRVTILAQVADIWLDLAATDDARRCIAAAEEMADALPRATRGARASCALIGPLVRIDPERARRRLGRLLDPADLDMCRLTIASRLVATDPAAAVRTFRLVRDPQRQLRALPEFAYRLGAVDPAAARTLIEAARSARPVESAYALGMLGAGLAATDRAAASATIRAAFARLEAANEAGATTLADDLVEPAVAAATLLPIAEQVDPTLLPELFWKAVSLRPAHARGGLRGDALLALLLERYDRTAARLVFDPRRIRRSLITAADLPSAVLAAAQLAPDVAFRWATTAADPPESSPTSPGNPDESRLLLIAHWCNADRGRPDCAARHLLDLWTPRELTTRH